MYWSALAEYRRDGSDGAPGRDRGTAGDGRDPVAGVRVTPLFVSAAAGHRVGRQDVFECPDRVSGFAGVFSERNLPPVRADREGF